MFDIWYLQPGVPHTLRKFPGMGNLHFVDCYLYLKLEFAIYNTWYVVVCITQYATCYRGIFSIIRDVGHLGAGLTYRR